MREACPLLFGISGFTVSRNFERDRIAPVLSGRGLWFGAFGECIGPWGGMPWLLLKTWCRFPGTYKYSEDSWQLSIPGFKGFPFSQSLQMVQDLGLLGFGDRKSWRYSCGVPRHIPGQTVGFPFETDGSVDCRCQDSDMTLPGSDLFICGKGKLISVFSVTDNFLPGVVRHLEVVS